MKPKELKIPEWIEKMQALMKKTVKIPKKQVPEWLEG